MALAVPGRPTKPLAQVVAELRAKQGLVSDTELLQRRPSRLPTELPEVDALLGGGLPVGAIVEVGRAPLGAGTALALRLVERLTSQGHLVAYCDGADAFDAESAARAGVDLARLFWARPKTLEVALRSVYALLTSGGFPLVVLDIGELADRGRPPLESTWLRVARAAELARTTLLLLGSERCTSGAFATVGLRVERTRPQFRGRGPNRVFVGVEATIALVRNKLGVQPGQAALFLDTPLLEPLETAP